MMVSNPENIFARIGGIEAMHDIVDLFYDKVIADPRVNYFFHNADMNVQRGKMKAFLMMALGGPARFTGKDMRRAHSHLVTAGLNDGHFSIIGEYLREALQTNNVDADIIDEVGLILENVRNDVLNK
jgi:hemoglobin